MLKDLVRYVEQPVAFSTIIPSSKALRGREMIVRNLDFFQIRPWVNDQQLVRHLLFFINVQNSVGGEMFNLMLNNSESISETCQKLSYAREDNSSRDKRSIFQSHFVFLMLGLTNYYFPTTFHIFVTMSKHT